MGKLGAIINIAHGVIYKVYTENYSFDVQCAPVMSVVNIESFIRLWNDRMKIENNNEDDLAFSVRDIYSDHNRRSIQCRTIYHVYGIFTEAPR